MYWEVLFGARARHEELLREAEEWRRMHQLQARQPVSPRLFEPASRAFHHRMLARLGKWLVAWGLSLQARYDVHLGNLTASLPEQEG